MSGEQEMKAGQEYLYFEPSSANAINRLTIRSASHEDYKIDIPLNNNQSKSAF